VRVLLAIAATVLLLAGLAAPHHHAAPGSTHDCVACTVGAGLEAADATPALPPPAWHREARAAGPGADPVTGAPLGAVPGQSPPA
jgi:hypothetical protein